MIVAVELQDSQVSAAFDALTAFGGNLRPALNEIGADIEQSTRDRFNAGVAPDGSKWRALAWATLVARARRGRSMARGGPLVAKTGIHRASFSRRLAGIAGSSKPLMDTRTHLYQTLTHKTEGNTVLIGVAAPWARIHQYGGRAGRGRKVTIPARPIFGITVQDRANALDVLKRRATAAMLAGATLS